MNKVTLNLQELTNLRAALAEQKNARVRVGVLGNHAERFDEDWNKEKINNPTLGLIHEFGSKTQKVPARSFLRMPLITQLPKKVDQIGRAVWRAIVLKQGLVPALKALGILGEAQVQEAFATGGFGQWPKWSTRYAVRRAREERTRAGGKGANFIGPIRLALLIRTAQLRKSITSRVYEGTKPL